MLEYTGKDMFVTLQGSKIDYDIRTYRNHRRQSDAPRNTKLKVTAGAVVGTVLPMLYVAKKQNVKLHKINYGIKEMMLISSGGILGGLAAGVVFDKKEHRKQKVNESVFQFMNAAVPTLLVGGMFALAQKFKALNNIPYKIGSTAVGLVGGMFLAAKLSNLINDPYDKVPDRKLTIKDAVANADDALGALVLAKVPMVDKLQVDKALPAIYGWCGYRAGMSN